MRVLVACEFSDMVRSAFERRGFDAWSCDLLPCENPDNKKHIQADARTILHDDWRLIIAHPDCTYLTNSAAWAFKDPDYDRYPGVGYHQRVKPGTLVGEARRKTRIEALDFVQLIMGLPCESICIENPPGAISTSIRKPDQYIQPYEYGEDASKITALWLKGLPLLKPTQRVQGRMINGERERWGNQTDSGQNKLTPSATRWMDRSRFYTGIADAMAEQWGEYLLQSQKDPDDEKSTYYEWPDGVWCSEEDGELENYLSWPCAKSDDYMTLYLTMEEAIERYGL